MRDYIESTYEMQTSCRIQQKIKFKYLGTEIRNLTMSAKKIAACLYNTICRNKYLEIDATTRIYKAALRSIMTYTAEIRPDTVKTKWMLETGEIKILRGIIKKKH